jgi:hypothetical protein
MDHQDSPSKDLLQTWMHITQALISAGHAAHLHQALRRACSNSPEILVQGNHPAGDCQTALDASTPAFDSSLSTAIGGIQSINGYDAHPGLGESSDVFTSVEKS